VAGSEQEAAADELLAELAQTLAVLDFFVNRFNIVVDDQSQDFYVRSKHRSAADYLTSARSLLEFAATSLGQLSSGGKQSVAELVDQARHQLDDQQQQTWERPEAEKNFFENVTTRISPQGLVA
jgi:hypothetical protein